jgi:hypothetical protein
MSEIPVQHDDHGASAHVADGHGATEIVGPHGAAGDHGDDHGHDDHGHASEALGGIDWPMWGVGVLGVALALVMTAALTMSTGFNFGT